MVYKVNRMNYKCGICGNSTGNVCYTVKEMMFGTREVFDYFQCRECGCLQIADIPGDMSSYYPENYYSFHAADTNKSLKRKFANYLLRKAVAHRLGHYSSIGQIAIRYNSYYKNTHPWMLKNWVSMESSVLDVGCGNGFLLQQMKQLGFNKLTGIDPFVKASHTLNGGIPIHKKTIFEINQSFDLIMLHHSFEHMDNPYGVFSQLSTILAPGGTILLRIPVADSYAWRKYGVDWYQIDAPRHLFVNTTKSISFLADKAGLVVEHILYDSTPLQIIISEAHKQNIATNEKLPAYSPEEMCAFQLKTNELNAMGDGDMACFFIRKNKSNVHE